MSINDMLQAVLTDVEIHRKLVLEIEGTSTIMIVAYDVEGTTFIVGDNYKQLMTREGDLPMHLFTEHVKEGVTFLTFPTESEKAIKEIVLKFGWLWVEGNCKYL